MLRRQAKLLVGNNLLCRINTHKHTKKHSVSIDSYTNHLSQTGKIPVSVQDNMISKNFIYENLALKHNWKKKQ